MPHVVVVAVVAVVVRAVSRVARAANGAIVAVAGLAVVFFPVFFFLAGGGFQMAMERISSVCADM